MLVAILGSLRSTILAFRSFILTFLLILLFLALGAFILYQQCYVAAIICHMYPLYPGAPISAQPYPPSGGEGGAPPPPPPSGGATEQQGTAPPPNVVDAVSGYEGVTFQGGKRT